MNTSKVLLGVGAMTLTLFGGYKMASAVASSNHWRGGIMHKIQALSEEDWNDPEKIGKLQQSCVDGSVEKLTSFIDRLESELDIGTGQIDPWNELKSSIQAEYETIQLVCGKLLVRENSANLPARLELMSVLMTSGQESLQRLIPAINSLYASLDVEQQALIEDKLSRHHKNMGSMHR
ncbi:MAG: Spy/CpxP family protein refolding chaperone [Thiohalomonadales bacterium]